MSNNLPLKKTNSKISYSDLQKLVWSFADLIRDKGEGTTEDYARVTVPTLALKRILDVKDEFLKPALLAMKTEIDSGLFDIKTALMRINAKHYKFFDATLWQSGTSPTVMLLSWNDVLAFKDNPNKDEVKIELEHGQTYVTRAGNFVELFSEIIQAMDKKLRWVFESFNYQNLILSNKPILPYDEFYKICHSTASDGLNGYVFSNANVDGDIFGDVYMDLIGRFAHDSGKKGGEFFTPAPLTDGAIRFLNIKKLAEDLTKGNKKRLLIADPTSGSNTFLIRFQEQLRKETEKLGKSLPKDSTHFYTQELKQFQAALGILNMVFHELSDVHNIGIPLEHQVSNVITNYKNGLGQKAGQIDVALANPPYGLKDYGERFALDHQETDPRFAISVPKKSEGEHAFLLTILDMLNQQGQAVVVMPLGTLFRDSGAKIREYLIKKDVIEGIVSLPANMFLTTSIPVVLWILNKNKTTQDKNKVFMVNADHDFIKVGKFNEWQQDTSVEAYHARQAIEGYCGYVTQDQLEKAGYNMSVSRYFSKKVEKEIIDILALSKEIETLEKDIESASKEMNDIFAQVFDLENKR